jgi:ribosome-associated toxin RatA of RatAB toxin-antitoxin module
LGKGITGFSVIFLLLVTVLPSKGGAPVSVDEVELHENKKVEGKEGILATLRIPASPAAVWRVLTDYNHLSEFIPDLLVSRVMGEKEGDILLYQQGKARLLFYVFRSSVTLRIQEEPYRRITFFKTSGDFDYFEGYWLLEPLEEGKETALTYGLWAHPAFYVPHWLTEMMLKRDVPKRLFALKTRIISQATAEP